MISNKLVHRYISEDHIMLDAFGDGFLNHWGYASGEQQYDRFVREHGALCLRQH